MFCKVALGKSNSCGKLEIPLLLKESASSVVMHGSIHKEESLSNHKPWRRGEEKKYRERERDIKNEQHYWVKILRI